MSIDLAALDELPPTGARAFAVGALNILLCRSSAGVFAIENRCSHAMSPLEGGRVRGPHIFCPLHGVRFDLRTGAPSGELTRAPVRVWPVRIEAGRVLVDL